ncbi:MAG: NAD-dependent epimerase/dehydratase family protein [Brevundimonas sp.]|uniref:NAD-dependent epimerase/dehydratase family protein n=1 Tax=Brevundimonas sp. TaxID=1871086 RepID=UPI001A330A91|nr:NAD-dependent epimerase/dehydratase family protein [Brevundimonas sp.]MBJ7446605.1 NAD-dependent epimerase/dehydratase family protein [Brevundimonas sp.]
MIMSASSEPVHIILGAGALGRATARALIADGRPTRLVSRTPRPAPQGATPVTADLLDPTGLALTMRDAEAVYFCAQPPYHRWSQEFAILQAAAVQAASNVGARLISAENLYGYGPVYGPMTEDLPLTPNTRKGAVRAAMHEQLMRAHDAGQVEVAVARGSDFFGPGVDGSAVGARAFDALLKGQAVPMLGDLDALHSWTFVEDFGRALATLGQDTRALGQVWHVPNAPPVSARRFFELAGRLAGVPGKVRRMGRTELAIGGLFVPAAREIVEMMYEFDEPFVVDHGKFARAFGDLSTPLERALAITVEAYRSERDDRAVA